MFTRDNTNDSFAAFHNFDSQQYRVTRNYWQSGTHIQGRFINNEFLSHDPWIEDSVVLDIGAHIGSFSMQMSNFNVRHVYAYEAHPENFKYLKKNLRKDKNISIFNKSVFYKKGHLYVPEKYYNFMGLDILDTLGVECSTSFQEDCFKSESISFDQAVCNAVQEQKKRINICKISVGRLIYPILFNSKYFNYIDTIIGECYVDPDDNFGSFNGFESNWEGLQSFLSEQGYSRINTTTFPVYDENKDIYRFNFKAER